jgi:hypothetical protein
MTRRRRSRKDLGFLKTQVRKVYPVAIGSHSYREVDGKTINTFEGKDAATYRDLYLAVAQKHLTTFEEIYDAMITTVYGPKVAAAARACDPPRIRWLLDKGMGEAERDAALLKLSLPAEEAYAIWQRACGHLRLYADLTPDLDVRQSILDAVAASEARMAERIERNVQRYEERKRSAV